MKFKTTGEKDNIADLKGTPIIPVENGNFPDEIFQRIVQRSDGRGGITEYERPLLEEKDGYYVIDLESLAHLIWEHRQYSRAQEFSPMQLEILRTVQVLSKNNDLILSDDINEYVGNKFNKNSISTALTKLEKRGLVKRVTRGVYQYNGFDNWSPPEE